MDIANYSHSGLVTICGATATGKSASAIATATALNSIIISADSRQVYREFDIGTAKPAIIEQQLVPHYLIDICAPTENLTVADYQQQAQAIIAQNLDKIPILVGGTGLYIRAIIHGLKIPSVPPQTELRSQLESLGQTQLYAFLQQVDAVAARKIHPHDLVRTLRALEVFYVTGRPISTQQAENRPNYPILAIGLDCDATRLHHRIAMRTTQMIADGFVAEVEYLCQKYGADLPLLNTLGYQEIKQYLAGNISLDAAQELIVLHTRQFAKRQRTWFRAYPEIEWFDADDPDLSIKIWQRVQNFLSNI